MLNRKVLFGSFTLVVILLASFILIPRLAVSEPVGNEPDIGFSPSYKEDNVPLTRVKNFEAVKRKYGLKLSGLQEKMLNDNKFLLVPLDSTNFSLGENFDQMLSDFDSIGGSDMIVERKPEDAVLITPDIVLHAYHKYFSLTLEMLERNELRAALNDFLAGLHGNLLTAARGNKGYVKERYQNLAAQIVLARVLLENCSLPKPDYFETGEQETAYSENDKVVDSFVNAKKLLSKYSSGLTSDLKGKVEYDLEKIYGASGMGVSPLFGQYNEELKTDYTQFTPRSHYNKSSILRAYFRAMMYLGRSSYFLKKDVGIVDANLLTKQFSVKDAKGIAPLDRWKKIMDITGFYAGQSDDLTYTEWSDLVAKILATDSDGALSSKDNVKKLAENLDKIRQPKILSDIIVDPGIAAKTKADLLRGSLAFRILGQRFSFDAWILNSLTAGQEKTETPLPSMPSALFVPAAFGDLRAAGHVRDFLKRDAGFNTDQVNGFLKALDNKKADIAKVKRDEWMASMGSSWLYVLGSLTHEYGRNYPLYMQAKAFLDKQIQTFLGSYAELKHDTILYAKQSYAEMGAAPDEERPIPPVVKGFVEPNMVFWSRLNELLDRTEDLFVTNNLFVDRSPAGRLKEFKRMCNFYADLAKKELQGARITDEEYEALRTKRLSFMAQPFAGDYPDKDTGKPALIADIHTDALSNRILYEATGKPYLMLAVVANEGTPRLTAGIVFNHYELTGPLGKRYTDEDWKARVYDGKGTSPEKNFWYKTLNIK